MDRLTPYLNNTHIYISGVLLTHAHFDHIYGLNEIIALFPTTKVYTNEFGKRMLLNEKDESQNIMIHHLFFQGKIQLKVLAMVAK